MTAEYTGPPMGLDNMRSLGVRALSVTCLKCHHEADVNVDDQPGYRAVPAFHGQFKCIQCGSKETQVMPAWHTRPGARYHPR
jgi:hypothetical protein